MPREHVKDCGAVVRACIGILMADFSGSVVRMLKRAIPFAIQEIMDLIKNGHIEINVARRRK